MSGVTDAYYDALLADLHATLLRSEALLFFHAWNIAEGGPATAHYNAFNTTYDMPGATWFNTFGSCPGESDGKCHVKNYPDATTGEKATFYTLIGGQQNVNNPETWTDPAHNRYATILRLLGVGGYKPTNNAGDLAVAVGNSGWGTSAQAIGNALVGRALHDATSGNPDNIPLPDSPLQSATNALTGWASGLSSLLANLLDPKFWLRIGQGAASVVLLLIGFGLVFRKDATTLLKSGALA